MVELPKDTEGREIPLDTVALYDDSGNVHSIRRFIYTNDFDLGDKWINSWIAVVDDYKVAKPEQLYLTEPDSWEKLDEDLHAVETYEDSPDCSDPACAYARNIGKPCAECKLYEGDCAVNMCTDIASRIHKLRVVANE